MQPRLFRKQRRALRCVSCGPVHGRRRQCQVLGVSSGLVLGTGCGFILHSVPTQFRFRGRKRQDDQLHLYGWLQGEPRRRIMYSVWCGQLQGGAGSIAVRLVRGRQVQFSRGQQFALYDVRPGQIWGQRGCSVWQSLSGLYSWLLQQFIRSNKCRHLSFLCRRKIL